MDKRNLIFRILDILGLTSQVVLIIVLTANIYNLFLTNFQYTFLVTSSIILSYAVYVLREKNLQGIISYYEKKDSYDTPDQVIYDLVNGEIVCFKMNNDYGVMYITDEDNFVVYFESQGNAFQKKIDEKEDLRDTVKSFMDKTNLFKNGIILDASKHKIETMNDLLSSSDEE